MVGSCNSYQYQRHLKLVASKLSTDFVHWTPGVEVNEAFFVATGNKHGNHGSWLAT